MKTLLEKNSRYIFYLLFLLLVIVVFHVWFLPGLLSASDLTFRFPSMFFNRLIYPYGWYFDQGNGLGGFAAPFLWTYFASGVPIVFFGGFLGFSWSLIERIGFFYPYLILSIVSSFYLSKKLLRFTFPLLSSFIFIFNTYTLMIISGGQVLVALAISLTPFVLSAFISAINTRRSFLPSLVTGLLFSVLFMIDIRLAYITLCAAFLYWLIMLCVNRSIYHAFFTLCTVFVIPGCITFLLHAFWILPVVLSHSNPAEQLGSAFNSSAAVRFLSFAKFEETISLLHPNWPENIFGKTYFMRQIFLFLPMFAFSSLYFLPKLKNKQEKIYIIFFSFLGLIGSFLAKGANEPFGTLYLWAFNHIPGFVMFRDSTKWYLFTILSYSILIPFSISSLYRFIASQKKLQMSDLPFLKKINTQIINSQNLFLVASIFLLLFLVRQAVFGQLNGTLISASVPSEYHTLEKFLSAQDQFSRTLWVPTTQRYGFFSATHPQIIASDFLHAVSTSNTIKILEAKKTEQLLQEASVKYVIVPYDSETEIFLKDRKYDDAIYKQTIRALQSIPYLTKLNGFGKIAIFEIGGTKNHFWSPDLGMGLDIKNENPTHYTIHVTNAKKGDQIIFSENFSHDWVLQPIDYTGSDIRSKKYQGVFNSFLITKSGNYNFEVYYLNQNYIQYGLIISVSSFFILLSLLVVILWKKRSSI